MLCRSLQFANCNWTTDMYKRMYIQTALRSEFSSNSTNSTYLDTECRIPAIRALTSRTWLKRFINGSMSQSRIPIDDCPITRETSRQYLKWSDFKCEINSLIKNQDRKYGKKIFFEYMKNNSKTCCERATSRENDNLNIRNLYMYIIYRTWFRKIRLRHHSSQRILIRWLNFILSFYNVTYL